MLPLLDTGLCIPESLATLKRQQAQLIAGGRDVQMFPIGTAELPLPDGLKRHENARGTFHFRNISREQIDALSKRGQENKFLKLGPFSKPEIAARVLAGEKLLRITEYTHDGIELRSAGGTSSTVEIQRSYFERTKEPGNSVVVDDVQPLLTERMAA